MVDALLECFYIPRNLKALEIFVLLHFLDANRYPLRLKILSLYRQMGLKALPERHEIRGLRGVFLWVPKAVVVVYVILDGIVTPVFRPLLRWVSRLGFVLRLQDLVSTFPPYAILGLLAVPFAFAEPAKIYALFLMSKGHFATGLAMMAMAYLVSLVVVERIYHAGRAKLKTIAWFAKLMDWLTGIRDRLLAWVRASRIWALSVRFKQATRVFLKKLRLRFRIG